MIQCKLRNWDVHTSSHTVSSLMFWSRVVSPIPPEKGQGQCPAVWTHVVFVDGKVAKGRDSGICWHHCLNFLVESLGLGRLGPISQRLALRDLWQWAVKSAFLPLASCLLTCAGAVAGQEIWCCKYLQISKRQSANATRPATVESIKFYHILVTCREHEEPSLRDYRLYFVNTYIFHSHICNSCICDYMRIYTCMYVIIYTHICHIYI